MSAFAKLNADFNMNWTTILVGWNGLGPFSPWPDRTDEFPPFLSNRELADYANDRMMDSCDVAEPDLIARLLLVGLPSRNRQAIREILSGLSVINGGDPPFELRKWRLILLEELLDNIPNDALYGIMALTEFWQTFGFPADSPQELRREGSEIKPSEYYQQQTFSQLLNRHRAWIHDERAALKKAHAVR